MANDSGFFDNPALLETLTIRARAAYYLAVTESIFAAIPLDDEGRNYAREAIKLAWQWVAGAPVEGDYLYVCVENAEGTCLFLDAFGMPQLLSDEKKYAVEREDDALAAWRAVCWAVIYVSWQAYKSEGKKYFPQTIEATDETAVLELHLYAEGTGKFDRQVPRRLLDYLQANYPASKPDDLGGPILRAGVIEAGGGTSIGDVQANDSGILDNPSLLWALTTRARVAYYLAVAESVFAAIPLDDEHRDNAIEAMNLAWQWVAGVPVEGDGIFEYFEYGDGTGLIATIASVRVADEYDHGYEKGDIVLGLYREGADPAWRAVCDAIMYAIWEVYQAEGRIYHYFQGYGAEGQKYIPWPIELANLITVSGFQKGAEKTGMFDHQVALRLLDYLQTNYPKSKPNELGGPISRTGVIAAGGGASIDA